MSTDKVDPKNPTEVLPKDATTELTEEELAKASAGEGVTFTYGKLQVNYQAQTPDGGVKSP
jgi:hypothetical protein